MNNMQKYYILLGCDQMSNETKSAANWKFIITYLLLFWACMIEMALQAFWYAVLLKSSIEMCEMQYHLLKNVYILYNPDSVDFLFKEISARIDSLNVLPSDNI